MSGLVRRLSVITALLAVAVAPLTAPASGPKAPASAISFAPSVVVDPSRLGSEPIMAADSKGNIYISSIPGFSNSTSFLWKSEDGGESFDAIRIDTPVPAWQRPDATLGGGDTALIVGKPKPGMKDDTLIFIDLEGLATFGTGTTFDGGNTFENPMPFASGTQPIGDRQWGGFWRDKQGTDHYYNFFNGIVSTAGINPADAKNATPGFGYAIVETTNYGTTWLDWMRGVVKTPGASRPGPLIVDEKTGDLLLTWTIDVAATSAKAATPVSAATKAMPAHGGAGFTRCTQQKVCTDTVIATMDGYSTNNTFVTGARDKAGNLYVAWSAIPVNPNNALICAPPVSPCSSAKGDTRIYMAASRNKGKTWTKPVVASGSLPAASMPTIIAGDAGRVSIVYYATQAKGDPNFNAGPWWVYMSQSVNALAAKPSFAIAKVSDHPNHLNPICTAGTGCTVDPQRSNDRNLSDFLYAVPGSHGETMVTWADTANQLGAHPPAGPSFTMFAKQTTGPSLSAKVGTLKPPPANVLPYSGKPNKVGRATPLNWRADQIADAHVPRHGTGGPGPQNASLDITGTSFEPGAHGQMRGVIRLRDTFNEIVPSPFNENFYMLWWWSNNAVHYAAVEIGPGDYGVSGSENLVNDCYAGAPSISNAYSARWALYVATSVPPPAITHIDCSFDQLHGVLTLNIPLDAVGARAGDTLYSVTASSNATLIANSAANAAANLPDEFDQSSPFTYKVGSARQQTAK